MYFRGQSEQYSFPVLCILVDASVEPLRATSRQQKFCYTYTDEMYSALEMFPLCQK